VKGILNMTALRALNFDEIEEIAGAVDASFTDLGGNSTMVSCPTGYTLTANFNYNTPTSMYTFTQQSSWTCSAGQAPGAQYAMIFNFAWYGAWTYSSSLRYGFS
jgi:hypothetical protein